VKDWEEGKNDMGRGRIRETTQVDGSQRGIRRACLSQNEVVGHHRQINGGITGGQSTCWGMTRRVVPLKGLTYWAGRQGENMDRGESLGPVKMRTEVRV